MIRPLAAERAEAMRQLLRRCGFDPVGESDRPLDHIYSLLRGNNMLDVSGGVLISSEAALSPRSDSIYFVGLNPGGDASIESAKNTFPTVEESLSMSRLGVSGWNQDWSRRGRRYDPGQAPMQRGFKHIARVLGRAPDEILATNIIFSRSRNLAMHPNFAVQIQTCLPIHEYLIRLLKPTRLWVMGNPDRAKGAIVLNSDVIWKEARHSNWRVGHGSAQFCGYEMVFCHTPHLSYWDATAADKQDLLAFAFGVDRD